MGYYNKDGVAIAIIHEGQRRGISPKGIQIAISTGLVESDLVMHCNDNDPDSKGYPYDAISYDYDSSGIFQQRPAYWGTCQQRMDVSASAGMFYDALSGYDYNSDAQTPGWYAYQVQKCAEEYAYRYDERYPEACDIYSRLAWMECPHQPGECRVTGDPGPLVSKTWMPEETNIGELILPYDHGITPQETGYWCGPASTQVVLNGQGIFVSEQELANEIGTHGGGTDYIGQIETVLDHRVPHMNYITVNQPYDPMSHEDKERLWANLIRSMADEPRGGVVMNWVAPPGNYPIGIKGSESPTYGGGTIYHYVAAMGFDDNPEQRAVWIADSGFYPFGYWCAFEQVSTLIPPKGYTYAAVEPTGPPVPPPAEKLSFDILSYEQMCGPRDPNGYGTGWAQLGQNDQGQNLYMVDALGVIKKIVEGRPVTFDYPKQAVAQTAPDYGKLDYEQLAGPVTDDGYGHGWVQLDNLSVTDAVASIKKVLEGGDPITGQPPSGGGETPPPVTGGRHALLTCSGTWAPPGVGFASDVAQGCSDVAEEIPVQAPWSFGPIPPGDFKAPSYKESVQIGVDWAVDYLLAHSNRTFLLGGYSQGGECAARIYQETLPGGRLESVRKNYVGGFTFGNPSRQAEHTFYAGPTRRGEGIAEFRQSGMGDDWADECEQGDMYPCVPTNLAGEIMRDIYTLCIEMEMHSGAAEFAQTLAANAMEVVQNLDGDAFDDLEETASTMGADVSGARRLDVSGISAGLRNGDGTLSVKGIAAAIEAAIIALTFFVQGTRPHIEYHIRQVFPGQTYVQHAIQHVRHWAATRLATS